ncbi:hypothetical protein WJX74_001823 [Apatococcus lobatus]|uniref:COX assembly mitochondrial protein n=1 Tax=Apatococcus lobatus TaxID=904363 RepID=A0AAW1RV91_9CHLO
MSCRRKLEALEDCRKKHPREQFICKHIEAAAGWCLVADICPQEVQDVEGCLGRQGAMPSLVPKRCQAAASRLEACIEAHHFVRRSELALPGKQPKNWQQPAVIGLHCYRQGSIKVLPRIHRRHEKSGRKPGWHPSYKRLLLRRLFWTARLTVCSRQLVQHITGSNASI